MSTEVEEQRARNRLPRGRKIRLSATVFLIAVAVFAGWWKCVNSQKPVGDGSIPPVGGEGPLIQRVSLESIRSGLGWRVPLLPAVTLETCDGKQSPVRLLHAERRHGVLTLAYTHGLLLFAAPDTRANVYGQGTTTTAGRVRGLAAHTADVGKYQHYFWCGLEVFACGDYRAGRGGARWYPAGASIRWDEKGVAMAIQGPYRLGVLTKLAEALTFAGP